MDLCPWRGPSVPSVIRKRDLIAVGFRSLFIQASWNYERMLGLGWAFAMMPILHRLKLDDHGRKAFLKRSLGFFNTSPFVSSFALGTVAKLEEQGAEESIDRIKGALAGPLGSLGDRFFWQSLRPMAALLGVAAAQLWGVWGIPVFLLAFNLPHLFFRLYGVTRGYRLGLQVAKEFSRPLYQALPRWSERLAALGLGILIGLSALGNQPTHWAWPAILVLSVGFGLVLLKKGRSPSLLFGLVLIAGMAATWF
ncbi:MAG: PTS system mannose/fructose/sorbose family transporter subunit IID [Candidatus Latescibacterota bacterium]